MTRLYKLANGALVPVPGGRLATEDMIQKWVAERPTLVGLDMLVIGREVVTDFGGRIDVLGIEADGDLAIVELKRDRTPREIVAQVLDYASWVQQLTTPRLHEIAQAHLQRSLAAAFVERFGVPPPDQLNQNHKMIVVASSLDASSQRIIRYLSETHGIAINTTFFTVFDHGGETLLTTDWLLDQQEVVSRSEAKVQAPWLGLWYVNAGGGEHRSWEDMRRYGFIAAGNGRTYSDPLRRLDVGAPIVAYQKGAGYVGYGTVTAPSVIARDFVTAQGPLLDQKLTEPALAHDRDDPELAEYAVGVEWSKAVPVSEAVRFDGMFANQNIVCKLRDPQTIEVLKERFGVKLD
jgi:hypothetical protein